MVVLSLPFVPGVTLPGTGSDGDSKGSAPALISALYFHPQMLRRRVGGTLRRSDSQQAVKSPPLLVSVTPSTLAPRLALPPPMRSLMPLPLLPQESPDASRESMVKLSVSFPQGLVRLVLVGRFGEAQALTPPFVTEQAECRELAGDWQSQHRCQCH